MVSLAKGLWLIPIALVIVAGVRGAPGEKLDDVTWGKSNGKCRIGFTGFPTTAHVGDPIDGTVVIENTGADIVPIMLQSARPVWQISIVASLDNRAKVDNTSYAKGDLNWSGSFMLHKLGPSQKFEVPIRLTRLIDMSRTGGYRITFKFSNPSTRPSTQPSETVVNSKMLAIDVNE